MLGYDAYKIYIAVKSHFNSEYDFSLYNGRIKTSVSAYEDRSDRYMFEKLGERYTKPQMIGMFVSNLIKKENLWVGDLIVSDDAIDIYQDWMARVKGLGHLFELEMKNVIDFVYSKNVPFTSLFECKNGTHPNAFRMLQQNLIELETFVVLDSLFNLCDRWDGQIDDDIIWPSWSFKIKKYRTFLNPNKKQYAHRLKKLL